MPPRHRHTPCRAGSRRHLLLSAGSEAPPAPRHPAGPHHAPQPAGLPVPVPVPVPVPAQRLVAPVSLLISYGIFAHGWRRQARAGKGGGRGRAGL